MSALFEELDYQETPLGALSLRRRYSAQHQTDIYEVKLGDDFLMSSLFTASEIALADLALEHCAGDTLEVVVGGLGLGYTAGAALNDSRVRDLIVLDALQPVISWHQQKLVPLAPALVDDPRCQLICADFFERAAAATGFDPAQPERKFDAVLVDIDHTPDMLLSQDNAAFYQIDGLTKLAAHLKPKGVFGLWSNLPPDDAFTTRLTKVFASARAEPVTFHNPIQNRDITQTVYLAQNHANPVWAK